MNLNDIVADSRSWEDGASVLENFLREEIFFNITNANEFPKGGLSDAVRDGKAHMATAKLPDGQMAIFYTSKEDHRIKPPFCGISLREALQMTLLNGGVEGLLLQSDGDAWIAVQKDVIRTLDLTKGQERSRQQMRPR
ncbi:MULTISPECIES: hypothetical protein [Nitrospirillum]|nr:hypothetical protein [Nitrospirillum amazonense]MEC4592950.1 hypothetical protein [Nitrospirillum amazonense]